jgi:hypothetical protein
MVAALDAAPHRPSGLQHLHVARHRRERDLEPGRPRATSQLGQGFALVETGEPHVVISLENRVIGRTSTSRALLAGKD